MPAAVSRPTKHIHGLDHLRALAIFLVFLFHYGRLFPSPAWVTAISKFGWTGVDLFFVLSGYLISSQLLSVIDRQENISFYQFYIKRSFRILPAYLVTLLLYFLFPFVHEREALAPAWRYLTFTQNIGLNVSTAGTFSHAWSLCVEEQFYLLLPLVLALLAYWKLMTKAWILLIVLFAMGILLRLYAWHKLERLNPDEMDVQVYWRQWIYYPTWTRLDGLLSGITIAALFQFRPKIRNWIFGHGTILFFSSVLILVIAYIVTLDESSYNASIYGFAMIGIGYALLLAIAVNPHSGINKIRSSITTTIAGFSFGLYLIHKMVIHVTQEQLARIGIEKNSNLAFIACILTCLLGAYILQKLIERPFLLLRNRVLSRQER